MKNILIIILCAFSFQIVNAQITMAEKADWKPVGKLRSLGSTIASLEYRESGRDTTYLLLMRDFTRKGDNAETQFFTIKFNGVDNTLDTFYQLLKSFFLEENRSNKNYNQTFRLGDQMVYLQHTLLITGKGVMLSTKEGYINLSKGDIDKLFNKK